MSDDTAGQAWARLDYAEWAATKKTLQAVTQMMGKVRLALSPTQPEWMHACLLVTARGLTTGPMPLGDLSVELDLEVYDDALVVRVSDGRSGRVSLAPARCVAELYEDLMSLLSELGVPADIWDRPQEVSDTTPFHMNTHDCTYDPEAVGRWFGVVTAIANVFEEWKGRFFGRASVQFWWGAFDVAVLRFSGRHAVAPDDRGYIMRYDLDAEFMNAGFWPGDDSSPDPIFYAYIHPAPPGCELAAVNPKSAAWIERMGEWVLPYEDVRTSGDPAGVLLDFLDSVYAVAGSNGDWDLPSYEYRPPAPSARKA